MAEEKVEEKPIATEAIHIWEIDDPDHVILKEKTDTGVPATLHNIRAIIIHPLVRDVYGPENPETLEEIPDNIFEYIDECISEQKLSYNYIIDSFGKIIEMVKPPYRAVCSQSPNNKYHEFATNYFGDSICAADGTERTVNPNCCTISIAYDTTYYKLAKENIMEALIECTAYVLNKFARELEPEANVLRVAQLFKYNVSQILHDTDGKALGVHALNDELVDFLFNDKKNKTAPEGYEKLLDITMWDVFRVGVDKLRNKWLANYKQDNRGYPNVEGTVMRALDNSLPDDL